MKKFLAVALLAAPMASQAVELNPFVAFNSIDITVNPVLAQDSFDNEGNQVVDRTNLKSIDILSSSSTGAGAFLSGQVAKNISLIAEFSLFKGDADLLVGYNENTNSEPPSFNAVYSKNEIDPRNYRVGVQFHKVMRSGLIGFTRLGYERTHYSNIPQFSGPLVGVGSVVSESILAHLGVAIGRNDLNLLVEAGLIDNAPDRGYEFSSSLTFQLSDSFKMFLMGRYSQTESDAIFHYDEDTRLEMNMETTYTTGRLGVMWMF